MRSYRLFIVFAALVFRGGMPYVSDDMHTQAHTRSPLGSALYVFKGDPFQPGPLGVSTVTLDEDPDGIPKRTESVYIELVEWTDVCIITLQSNQH